MKTFLIIYITGFILCLMLYFINIHISAKIDELVKDDDDSEINYATVLIGLGFSLLSFIGVVIMYMITVTLKQDLEDAEQEYQRRNIQEDNTDK